MIISLVNINNDILLYSHQLEQKLKTDSEKLAYVQFVSIYFITFYIEVS